MELRSRRKLSTNPIVNASGYKSSSSSDDEKDDSISCSDDSDDSVSSSGDTLISDGKFDSDKDSDVEILSGKREVVVNDGEADCCAIDDKKRMNIGSNKKTTGAGSTSEAVENEDVERNVNNEAGLQGMPLADDNNSDPPGEDDIVEIPNIPPENVDPPTKKRKRGALMWQILEKEIRDWQIDADTDLGSLHKKINETAEAPSDLTMPLLRYQKEWLAWALKKEASEAHGGILADEMGMGKTIQAIALVLAKRERSRAASCFTESSLPGPSLTGLLEVKGTLVICPPVALTQWESEIIRFTAKGSTKVLIYHGASRGKTVRQLTEYDFVLTTYAIVETEYRRNATSKTDVEELSPRPRVKNFKKTPKGSKVESNTQHTSSMENGAFSQQSKSKMPLILHSLKWERIILDEAHYIKDRKRNTAQAVFALESSFKWALSGTPLQNRVGELYSLIRFLCINPYSYYFCRHCDCKILEYRPSRDCKSCTHPPYTHFFWWNKYVAKPIRTQGCSGEGKNAMNLLKNRILKDIMLRRTKKGRAAELALPPKIVSLRRDSMDITEEDYYTSLYKESRAEFNAYIQQGTLRNDYADMFGFLTRLQKAANHLYLVEYSKPKQQCGTCSITVKEAVVTPCDHVFCKECLTMFTSAGAAICPKCYDMSASSSNQKEIKSVRRYRESSILDRIQLEDFQTSTKIDALKEEIRFMLERDGSAKGLVFSQFPSFLDLISYSLGKSGISSVQLVGSMTMSDKDSAIKKFNEDPVCKIFLISLKAGGIALNLTVASHVFLMEPCWNPAVERQAVDRVHRIGQGKPTRIVRFVIENTIEERLLKIQEKKDLAFDGIMGGGSSEVLSKLTRDDLHFLFTYS